MLGPGDHIYELRSIYCMNNPFGGVSHDLLRSVFIILDQVYDPLLASAFNLHLEDSATRVY